MVDSEIILLIYLIFRDLVILIIIIQYSIVNRNNSNLPLYSGHTYITVTISQSFRWPTSLTILGFRNIHEYPCKNGMDMDMDMDGIFHLHGKPAYW